jgi:hypothetical protein
MSPFDLETDVAVHRDVQTTSSSIHDQAVPVLHANLGPFTGLTTGFSSQPIASAENFSSRSSSSVIVFMSVISGRGSLIKTPSVWSHNCFATEIAYSARVCCTVTRARRQLG